jgi:hypothetical protein
MKFAVLGLINFELTSTPELWKRIFEQKILRFRGAMSMTRWHGR